MDKPAGSKLSINIKKSPSFNEMNHKKYPSPRMCETCKKISTCVYTKKPGAWPIVYIYQCMECSGKCRRKSIV